MVFSGGAHETGEQVYQVSLAEFAAPQPAAAASPEPAAASPALDPEPVSPEPEPEPAEPPKREEPKAISAKKEQKKAPEPKKQAQSKPPAPPAQPVGPAEPSPNVVGGYAAYKSSQVDQKPSISRRAVPDYPSKAKRMQIEGKVLLQIVVDISGNPKACTVQLADPPGYFEEAALKAAKKTRFMPGKIRGKPVNTLVLLPFAFQLR